MTVKLAVAGAFHTEFMQPAVDQLRGALASTNMSTPRIPVISNVDAQPHSDPDTIRDILARQVGHPVACCMGFERCGLEALLLAASVRRHPPAVHLSLRMHVGMRAGDEPGAMGEDAQNAAGEGDAAELRDWAQQGHRWHHEAHRQDQPDHQHHCLSGGAATNNESSEVGIDMIRRRTERLAFLQKSY